MSDSKNTVEWISTPEAAEIIGITRQHIHTLLLLGEFGAYQDIRSDSSRPRYRINRAAVEEYAKNRIKLIDPSKKNGKK